ncbi:hypothetical protein HE1_00549 [Holospora elegans E1]|uniref:Uncharacterized protein n=2 Tax=Holospora TaxID=44747 RepID=A0A023DXQ2_9PROT|nr:hypothetical protein HE1_00549 [Holospora elegans E1]
MLNYNYLLLFFITNFSFLLYANKRSTGVKSHVATSKKRVFGAQADYNPANIASSWAEISNPEVSLQALEKSYLLTIKNWNSQNLSDFQSMPDFKQAKTLEEVKKIILKTLLKQKNVTPISKFLIQAKISDAWCRLLEYITYPLWNSKKSSYGISIKDVSALLSVPLSNIKCQELRLPVPENFLDAFEQADQVLSEQKQEETSCLFPNNEKNSSKEIHSQSLPGNPLPDGSLPGNPLPDGSLPGNPLPDGSLPGNPLPDGSLPGNPLPDGQALYKKSNHKTSYKKSLSTYVKGTECLEFWVASIIEQSMRYIKKKPHVWGAIFNSANADPMNQRIVQHLKRVMKEESSSDHQGDYDRGTQGYDYGSSPISASGSGAQGSSKPFTDPQYLDSREESSPQEPQEPVVKRRTVTFFSKKRK